jgi:ssDNA-binding Zn-finger/Zn-ribbon topoisomerase 1
MLHSAQCPHCKRTIASAKVENIKINGLDSEYKGVTYSCPWCHSVLSVSIDQIALNHDVVKRLLKALGRG